MTSVPPSVAISAATDRSISDSGEDMSQPCFEGADQLSYSSQFSAIASQSKGRIPFWISDSMFPLKAAASQQQITFE